MKTRSKILIAALMASAVGIAAVPASPTRRRQQQAASRWPGTTAAIGDDDRGGPRRAQTATMAVGGATITKARAALAVRVAQVGGRPGGPGGGMSEFLSSASTSTRTARSPRTKCHRRTPSGSRRTTPTATEQLSLAEFKALWADTMDREIVRAFQQLDPDGDAQVTLDEYSARFDRMFANLDRNGDGVIDKAELQARIGPGGPAVLVRSTARMRSWPTAWAPVRTRPGDWPRQRPGSGPGNGPNQN